MKRNKPTYAQENNALSYDVAELFGMNGVTSNYVDDRYSPSRQRHSLSWRYEIRHIMTFHM